MNIKNPIKTILMKCGKGNFLMKMDGLKKKLAGMLILSAVISGIGVASVGRAQTASLSDANIVIDSPTSNQEYIGTVWFHTSSSLSAQDESLLGLIYSWTVRGEGHQWTFKGKSGSLDMPVGSYAAILVTKDRYGRYYSTQTAFDVGDGTSSGSSDNTGNNSGYNDYDNYGNNYGNYNNGYGNYYNNPYNRYNNNYNNYNNRYNNYNGYNGNYYNGYNNNYNNNYNNRYNNGYGYNNGYNNRYNNYNNYNNYGNYNNRYNNYNGYNGYGYYNNNNRYYGNY